MLEITNSGPDIIATNYFESGNARAGALYLSINAGAFRLLLPPVLENTLAEMRTGKLTVVSRGVWQGRDALEIMYDDGSDNPFMSCLGVEQVDRLPARSDSGRDDLLFTVWTSGPVKVWECRCAYRVVGRLPCLKAWDLKRGN